MSAEQHDDHIWLTVFGGRWAIAWIEGDVFGIWRGRVPHIEYSELDVSAVNWERYCNKAVGMLKESE
jgi:hypothetical protein